MPNYAYATSLENSFKVAWTLDEVLGTKRFDLSKRWQPASLSGADALDFLDAREQRELTHVELAAYAHLFGYVEEFIAPMVGGLAREHELERRDAFDALTNFAAEEVKHMTLFRRVRDRVQEQLGLQLALVQDEVATARFVLGKRRAAALLLTSSIEWMTQRHYLESFKDDATLDPLVKEIFKAHWLEESQHAQLDHLETVRAFASLSASERDGAIDDLIELVAGVHGLLVQQVGHDIANLSARLGRDFTELERFQLHASLLRAKRWTFLTSGVTHPRFQELFTSVTTPPQRARVEAALARLLADDVAAVC
jgi:hypothetical protein